MFEIYDKAGNLVDTIKSDNCGLASSKPLPLGRYTIRETKAPANYGVSDTELTAYLEHEGQIVRFEVTNKSLTTGVSITKTGPKEAMAGQPVNYVFSSIANKVESGVRAIYLPTGQAVECTEERSRYANKQKAIARLNEITKQKNRKEQAAVKNTDWRCHTSLERGNAGAVFIGMEFRKK